jgi:hypothetical protein
MQLSHDPDKVSAVFDEANLVSCAGLAPVLALAERAGLSELLAEHLSVSSPNAPLKVTSLLAGMLAGADCVDDMDLLRHGAMDRLFEGVRAPSTLGTFLRAFTFGHVRQLDAVAARLLARLAACTPLLPGAGEVAYVDIDDTVRATHGYAKQGAGSGTRVSAASTPCSGSSRHRRRRPSSRARGCARARRTLPAAPPAWSPTPWQRRRRRAPTRRPALW